MTDFLLCLDALICSYSDWSGYNLKIILRASQPVKKLSVLHFQVMSSGGEKNKNLVFPSSQVVRAKL